MLKNLKGLSGVTALTQQEKRNLKGGYVPVGCNLGTWGCTYQTICFNRCGATFCYTECPAWCPAS